MSKSIDMSKTATPTQQAKGIIALAIVAGLIWFFFIRGSSGPDPTTPPMALPKSEAELIAMIGNARARYAAEGNELRQSNVALAAEAQLAPVLAAGADDWIGVLRTMGTNGDGNAFVTVEISRGIRITTWNNSFSDIGDHTLIAHGSAVYNSLAELKEGQWVRFSAALLRVNDLTERGRVEAPDILARFRKVAALQP